MAQLVLAECVPPSDAFVNTGRSGTAMVGGSSDVVLEDEIFAYHAGAVPYELVDVEGVGYGGREGLEAWIGALTIAFLCF